MDEERIYEVQALQAIFMHDFEVLEESGEGEVVAFALRVVPSPGGAFQNHLALRFSVRFPSGYPAQPITSIELEIVEGTMQDEELEYLKEIALKNMSTSAGEPSVFATVEKLKEHLELYNEDLTEGLFILLSNEVMFNILSYLPAPDLGHISRVNKNMRILAQDNRLWRNLYQELGLPTMDEDEIYTLEPGHWKKIYLKKLKLELPEMEFICSIVERKDTGDEWYLESSRKSWRDYFKAEAMELYGLDFTQYGRIQLNNHVVGHYRFLDLSQVASQYNGAEWFKNMDSLIHPRYLGKTIGYIAIETESFPVYFGVTKIARGILARLDDDKQYMQCIIEKPTFVSQILEHEGTIEGFDNIGFIVNPLRVKRRVKYLTEIVEAVNRALLPLRKDKSKVEKFVDCSNVQLLYPFRLNNKHEIQSLPEYSHISIHIMAHHPSAVFRLLKSRI